MPSVKILLVDDDSYLTNTLLAVLKNAYDIESTNSGKSALYKVDLTNYDIIILDLNLPDISGLAVCQQLRERGFTAPILILSGEAKVLTKISLLDAGANDYLTKPFALGELKARLRALSRTRNQTEQPAAELESYGVILNRRTFAVSRDGQDISLRPKEFKVLECLMEKAGTVLSRDELESYVWDESTELWTNTLDVHIKHLRDKLDRLFPISLIQTIHGRGFKFAPSTAKEKRAYGQSRY